MVFLHCLISRSTYTFAMPGSARSVLRNFVKNGVPEQPATLLNFPGTLHKSRCESYVYWTVHHLDSWIKKDQLDVTCFIISLFMLNMFRMLIHPSSGAWDLFVELFQGLYWSGSMCVCVTLWFGCGGVVSVCRLRHYRAINPLNNSSNKSQAPEDGYINIRNMLSIK